MNTIPGMKRRRDEEPRGLMRRNEDVATEVNRITATDSPIMQQAQTDGLKMANRRGLLNSSMAVGAAQNEVIRAALPMAQQTAGQNFQTNAQRREFRQQTGLQSNDIAARERMQERDQAFNRGAQERDLASREGMAVLDRSLQERLAQWNLDAAERQQAAGMLTSMQQVHAAQVQALMSNTAMDGTARQAQLDAMNAQNARRINLVEQMFGVRIEW